MAMRIEYSNRRPFGVHMTLRVARRRATVEAKGYEGVYFADGTLPDGKHQYYCRHSDTDWSRIVSIKRHRGLTVNFWGTVVTDEPIDFGGADEVDARVVDGRRRPRA